MPADLPSQTISECFAAADSAKMRRFQRRMQKLQLQSPSLKEVLEYSQRSVPCHRWRRSKNVPYHGPPQHQCGQTKDSKCAASVWWTVVLLRCARLSAGYRSASITHEWMTSESCRLMGSSCSLNPKILTYDIKYGEIGLTPQGLAGFIAAQGQDDGSSSANFWTASQLIIFIANGQTFLCPRNQRT